MFFLWKSLSIFFISKKITIMHNNGWVASYSSLIKSDRKSQGIATSSISLILMRTITLHYPQKLKRKKNTESKHRKEIFCRSEGIPIASHKKNQEKSNFLVQHFVQLECQHAFNLFQDSKLDENRIFFFFFFFSFISLIFPPTQNQGETFIAFLGIMRNNNKTKLKWK